MKRLFLIYLMLVTHILIGRVHAQDFNFNPTCSVEADTSELSQEPFLMYPNPFEDYLVIESESPGTFMVMIENHDREIVFSGYFKDKIEIRQDFAPGVYQVRVMGDSTTFVKRIVKK